MESAIKQLLNDLDILEERYPEITDTDVREDLAYVVVIGFIERKEGFRFPQTFQLWNPIAIWRVRRSLKKFLKRTKNIEFTSDERYEAFFQKSPKSDCGSETDDFFGSLDTKEEWIRAFTDYTPPTVFQFGKALFGAIWTTIR